MIDMICNGTGWLWQDKFQQMKCWRCCGTGQIPDSSSMPNIPIPVQNESDEEETT